MNSNTNSLQRARMTYSGKDADSFFINYRSLLGGLKYPFPQPAVVGFYSLDLQRTFCAMLKLTYIVRPESYDDINFDLNIGIDDAVKRDEPKWDNLLQWILVKKPKLDVNPQGRLLQDIVSLLSTLRMIMNTPYQKQEDWMICATKYKGTIYLHYYIRKHREKSDLHKKALMWGKKFEQYLTSDHFEERPNLENQFEYIEKLKVVFMYKLNNHHILYAGKVDGFISQNEIRTLEDLKKAEFVELQTSRINETERQYLNTVRFKYPKWWAKCYLSNVSKLVCGFRTDEGIVKHIKEYNTADLPKMSENKRSPEVCLNYLDKFLNIVKSVVQESSPDTVYVFERKPSSGEITTIRVEGPSEYSFLYKWYTDCM